MKRLTLRLMKSCGVFSLARVMSSGMARILMYHNFSNGRTTDAGSVNATTLREQLEYLVRHFHVVPLPRVFQQLKQRRSLDQLTTVLTIDDGRSNCYDVLFPLLKEFRVPATFFVVTSFINREDWLWTDKILWLSEQPSRPRELSAEEIEKTFSNLNRLRPEVRTQYIEGLATCMSVRIPVEAPSQYAPCSWDQLREMAESGLVEIGSHTVTHPILSGVTDDECWRELTISRAQIELALGRPVAAFCFPNGKTGDYRLSQLQQVREAGYKGAVAANSGLVTNQSNPYELPRLGVSGYDDSISFAQNLDGVEHYVRTSVGLRRPS
jgi:peptidoglycan/xylan/chitin deacetylase (PgdA/CDA1 family)